MPELPEVETVRATLAPRWVGRRIVSVRVGRASVIRLVEGARAPALGRGAVVTELRRHGKQLAVLFDSGRAMLVHLGMTGQLFVLAPGAAPPRHDHIHIRWTLDDGAAVCFRDPRRFGGVWLYASFDGLRRARWEALGPDALRISTASLYANLNNSARAIKACLLDQTVLAGVGNIYADEALFMAGINPHTPARALPRPDVVRLASSVRSVLRDAVRARGSSLRDYLDAELRPGTQQNRFRVYGRGGLPCPRCGCLLETTRVAQRTTASCPHCQPVPGAGGSADSLST